MNEKELEDLFAQARQYLDRIAERSKEPAWQELQRRLQQPALRRFQQRLARFERGSGRLRLVDRKDILLLLLYAQTRLKRGICGMTRILKLLFLASKELGTDRLVPNPYRFQPYRLGPFSSAVYDDLDILVRAGLLARTTLDATGMSVIQLDQKTTLALKRLNSNLGETERLASLTTAFQLTSLGQRFCQALSRHCRNRHPGLEPGLALLKDCFGTLPLRELLRYIYTRYPEYTAESEILEQVLGPRSKD